MQKQQYLKKKITLSAVSNNELGNNDGHSDMDIIYARENPLNSTFLTCNLCGGTPKQLNGMILCTRRTSNEQKSDQIR